MLNKNLSLLAALFVSMVILGSGTIMVSNMILEAGYGDLYPDEGSYDSTPKVLTIEELGSMESTEISSQEYEEFPFIDDIQEEMDNIRISNFTSNEELQSFIENHTYETQEYLYDYRASFSDPSITMPSTSAPMLNLRVNGNSVSGEDHSDTNSQVEGVNEGDLLKNDGEYAYIVSKNYYSIVIVKAYPAEDAKVVSKIDVNGNIREIYLYGNLLVVLGSKSPGLYVYIFDVYDKEEPELVKAYNHKSSITQSRMIGEYLYIISSQSLTQDMTDKEMGINWDKAYHFNDCNYTTNSRYIPLTSIISINVKDPNSESRIRAIFMEQSQIIYVSTSNIYLTYLKWDSKGSYYGENQVTVIHRISIDKGKIVYKAVGEVSGRILNRFSMDEHEGHFRVATTTGEVWRSGNGGAKNHMYVMGMDMNITGSIKDIAPTEKIYSARFMGNRAYVVTFKKVDPFFVIDLSNPKEPKILGELKIPGYSDYLHPYDENHVIGLGKDTYDMGTFAWYQGVKLSLFDVTNVSNPKELSKFVIGDRGTSSLAQSDPHAFLFSKKNNLLVIPISLYEINRTQNPNPAPNTQGQFTWEGAYVLNITKESGFVLKGRISHSDDELVQPEYYFGGGYSFGDPIRRSFYIGDVLYTLSGNKLKMNDMEDLSEINEVELPGSSNYEWIFISTPIKMTSP